MIVFDLDGTIALDEHRVHHLCKPEKDWQAYFNACDQDAPHSAIIQVLFALHARGHKLALWSGRSTSVAEKTRLWLVQHEIYNKLWDLRFRGLDDRTNDDLLKEQWLHQHNSLYPEDPVTLVFEDRARVVNMWRRNNVTCCQVAPGDF